jgi:serine/threonine protein kinase
MAQPTKNTAAPEMASFGKLAIQLGYITQNQLEEAMRAQSAAAKAGLRKRLGDILIKKGYLSQEQLQKVLKGQTVNRKRIAQYELISKLGEGGMGAVFKARQVYMDRIIALKILSTKLAKNQDFLRRFRREAQAVAKLNHPNIIAGIDCGSADGYVYFAMEYVEGETLGEYMHRKGGRLPEKQGLDFIHQMALALQHAHENNMLHRDVKPDNILLEKEHKVAKLADLGLVRSAESREDDAALTQAGQAVGTPFYISPEQARGISDLTAATDIYSLGASLYHVVTGEVPYDGQTAAVIMTRHITDPVPSVRKINAKLSIGCEKLVSRAMQKNASERFRSMDEFAAAIQQVMGTGDFTSSEAEEMPLQPRKATRPAPAKVEVRDDPEPAEPEIEDEHEEEDDADEVATGRPTREATRLIASTGPHSATRGRRRKQGNDWFSLGLAVLIIAVCCIVLYYWNPFTPSSPSGGGNTKQTSNKNPPIPPGPVMKAATPAVLRADPAGGRVFAVALDQPLVNFDVEPLMFNGAMPEISSDGKSVVLAAVRSGDFACNARLVLPHDLVVTPNCTVSFLICLVPTGGGGDVTPEIELNWDNQQEGNKRMLSRWTISDSGCKGNWLEVKRTLKSAPMTAPTNQSAEGPQFISISAGRAKEKLVAYVAKLEIHDSPAAPATPRGEKSPAPSPSPSSEAPVAPPRRAVPDTIPSSTPGKKIDKNEKTDPDDAIKKAL